MSSQSNTTQTGSGKSVTSTVTSIANQTQALTSTIYEKVQPFISLCDLIPPVPDLTTLIANFPIFLLYLVTIPIRFPICLLVSLFADVDYLCLLYNLFPFLSIINLFSVEQTQCKFFYCPDCAFGCSPNFSFQSPFQNCPNSIANVIFCTFGYVFLLPIGLFVPFINFALHLLGINTCISFQFNCFNGLGGSG